MKRIVSHSPMSAALGAVAFLLAGCASVATQQAAAPDAPLAVASAPAALAEQSLHLATAPNVRDVGGYRTADGRRVRTGLIYRSDQLNRLSDADLATIGGLGLGLGVD